MRISNAWFSWKELTGLDEVPAEAAIVMSEAMKKAIREGDITYQNRWQLLEYLCAEFLQGPDRGK